VTPHPPAQGERPDVEGLRFCVSEALEREKAVLEGALRYLAYGIEVAGGYVRVLQAPAAITSDGLREARAALSDSGQGQGE
jgi:hypothetical protein